MDSKPFLRRLSIGEFAAATQLSPKALRLYDEQRVLPPASVDAASGYRYYAADQIPLGRLIRTLREMGLPLSQIASVVSLKAAPAERLLGECARELDRQYAERKRAFQAATILMRHAAPSEVPAIIERQRAATTVAVQPFAAARHEFIERSRAEARAAREVLQRAGLDPAAEAFCSLLDPLTEEEGRLELLTPICLPGRIPAGVSVRQLAAAPCAEMIVDTRQRHASELTAALDALFDWFDRRGYRALEAPLVSIDTQPAVHSMTIVWPYDAAAIPQGTSQSRKNT